MDCSNAINTSPKTNPRAIFRFTVGREVWYPEIARCSKGWGVRHEKPIYDTFSCTGGRITRIQARKWLADWIWETYKTCFSCSLKKF